MRQILIAAAVGMAVTLLGTPLAIRLFRVWGWGQRIREDVFLGWTYAGLATPVLFTGWFGLVARHTMTGRIYFDQGQVVTEREHQRRIERSLVGAISLA